MSGGVREGGDPATMIEGGPWDGFELIHVTTRQDLLDEGQLIDVSEHAKRFGLNLPTAITANVWAEAVEWTPEQEAEARGHGQSEAGRLDDLCMAASVAARATSRRWPNARHALLSLDVLGAGGRRTRRQYQMLGGPGDAAEPVLTIMAMDED